MTIRKLPDILCKPRDVFDWCCADVMASHLADPQPELKVKDLSKASRSRIKFLKLSKGCYDHGRSNSFMFGYKRYQLCSEVAKRGVSTRVLYKPPMVLDALCRRDSMMSTRSKAFAWSGVVASQSGNQREGQVGGLHEKPSRLLPRRSFLSKLAIEGDKHACIAIVPSLSHSFSSCMPHVLISHSRRLGGIKISDKSRWPKGRGEAHHRSRATSNNVHAFNIHSTSINQH